MPIWARARARYESGNYQGSLEDYDQAINLNPRNAVYFNTRGHTKFVLGQFSGAADDFARAAEMGLGFDNDILLWQHVARARAGESDLADAARAITKTNAGVWPGPIVLLFGGQATPAQTRTAAEQMFFVTKAQQVCERAGLDPDSFVVLPFLE